MSKTAKSNPCCVCGGPIDGVGTFIGMGDGSMRDGGQFAHAECYYRHQTATLTATNAELREQVERMTREIDGIKSDAAKQVQAFTEAVGEWRTRAEAAERAAVKLKDAEVQQYIDRCRAMSNNGEYAWWSRLAEILSTLSPAEREPEQAAVARPRLLDLSNLLKHAFISGRESVRGASSFHAEAWVEYDPEQCPAYARISAALTAAMEAKR